MTLSSPTAHLSPRSPRRLEERALPGRARLQAFQRTLALWVLRVWLALALSAAALTKLIGEPDQVRTLFPWSSFTGPDVVAALGAVELMEAAGLLVPWAARAGPGVYRVSAMISFGLGAGFALVHLAALELAAAAFSVTLASAALLISVARPDPKVDPGAGPAR